VSNNAKEIVLALLAGGVSKADIAKRIGYGRSSVSRWINEPDFNGENIEKAVLENLSQLICPYLKKGITPTDCLGFSLRPCPTCNAREVRHWKFCQTCPNKPTQESSKGA
jgi:transcriptional regulator with XRE-family HTH domain